MPYLMTMYHLRKTRKRYNALKNPNVCPFCNIEELATRTRRNTEHFRIVKTDPGYDVWELHDVADHLMILPKRHVERLSEFTEAEQLEYAKLVAEYLDNDYSIYARANNSPRRTVHHQHTHLIKIGPKDARVSFFMSKPYLFIKF